MSPISARMPILASTASLSLFHSQEYHTSYWGHLGLPGLERNFLLPAYAGYVNTAAASLAPTNADIADLAHAQKALVGYVHPFDTFPDPASSEPLTDELPVDVPLARWTTSRSSASATTSPPPPCGTSC